MADSIKFYLDEHVAEAVAEGLRRRGVDVLTVPEAGRLSQPDQLHLERAVRERRVVFTQDRDFLRLHAAGTPHRGIVYCDKDSRSIGEIIQGLVLAWEVLEPDEVVNRVEFL